MSEQPFTPQQEEVWNCIRQLHEHFCKLPLDQRQTVTEDWVEGIHKLQDVIINLGFKNHFPEILR